MKKESSLGVIVARFQTDDLHLGHRTLIKYVLSRHRRILVVLGQARTLRTFGDPLDIGTREAMVKAAYSNRRVMVARIRGDRSNERWSERLDEIIRTAAGSRGAILYGSRESFLQVYCGQYSTRQMPEIPGLSGTAERQRVKKEVLVSRDFRAGQIYAVLNRPAIAYQAVDVAVICRYTGRVLLGKKNADGGKYRFIGGFVDATDESLEDAGKREVWEEASMIEIGTLQYMGSRKIDDWRYRYSGGDGIMSAFFVADFVFGSPKAGDDLDEVAWFPFHNIEEILVPEHLPLAALLKVNVALESTSP